MRIYGVSVKMVSVMACLCVAAAAYATDPAPSLSEIPASFTPRTETFDYVRRDVMIPMRDGIKLKTVILIPKGATRAPILLSRTPYGAVSRYAGRPSKHLAEVLGESDVAEEAVLSGGYIRVVQDIRGKHGSEGDYVMNRPLIGPLNPTTVDHTTDTYDTIDWLVKNIPETNGKVGIYGISYDGFTALMAVIHPHPALKISIPINSMVDGWRGDDWFHNGAFRQSSLNYAYAQEASRDSSHDWWSDDYDEYATWLKAGSAGDMAKLHGLETIGFAQKLMNHPAYDSFWQQQAMDEILAKEPMQVPMMIVHSLWDQEDIYGGIAVYKKLKPRDTNNSKIFLVLGPWYHHQQRLDGSAIGAIKFGADEALYFRRNILRPVLDHFLKDEAPPLTIAPVTAFETGTNTWHDLPSWPQGSSKTLYLQAGGKLGFHEPGASDPGYEEYVSDPAKPIPFLPRPIHLDGNDHWQSWLVSDQRDVSTRTDVLTFTSDVLTQPLKISGEPITNLIASTTGTDGDFVVKLIDVYPEENGREPVMGGYELMVSADILRGRYRNDFAKPTAIPAGEKQRYRFALPTANHVFLPGHRLMVQIQSSWFPLYDRNPQSFVDNIFFAKPADYHKATIRVFDSPKDASFVELPVVGTIPQ